MASKALVRPERCKECGLCVYNCAKKAISFSTELNGGGYHYIVVDEAKCVGCGICYTTCPDGALEIREGF